MEVRACYVFGVSLFPGYLVRCGQGGSKSIRKDKESLARKEAFCGHGQVSEEISDFISPVLWLRELKSLRFALK